MFVTFAFDYYILSILFYGNIHHRNRLQAYF